MKLPKKPALPAERLLDLSGTAADVALIKSVMYYPEDPVTREAYVAWNRHLEGLDDAPEMLDRGPSVAPTHLAERTRHATVVGGVLACYFLLDHFKSIGGVFAEPSMDKAIHAARGFARYARKFRDDSTIHAAKRTINKYWTEFRAASPLWAAMLLNDEDSPYRFMLPDAQFDSADNIALFIGVAAALRKFGTSTTDVQDRPLLNGRTWYFKGNFTEWALPAMTAIDDRLMIIMNSYSPRSSTYEISRPKKP